MAESRWLSVVSFGKLSSSSDHGKLRKYATEFRKVYGSHLDWIFRDLDHIETLGYSFDLIKVSKYINPYFDDQTVLGRELDGLFGYDSAVIWGEDAKPIKKYKNKIKLRKLAYNNLIKSSSLGVVDRLLNQIYAGFHTSFVEYREFQSLYFFLERLYFLRLGHRLGLRDLTNVYFGGLDEFLIFYLQDFDETEDPPVYDSSFFIQLNKLKYPDDKTADFFYKSRKVINTALKMNYKDFNTSTFIEAEEGLIVYLSGSSAVINDRPQVVAKDVIAAYETYYKLLKTDVTKYKANSETLKQFGIELPPNTQGYLICDKCSGYYQLQPDESADDFSDTCECGGELKYKENLED